MNPTRRTLAESAGAALLAYALAAMLEAAIIRVARPTEWELAWVSDVALAVALGVAVYFWRHLHATRGQLAERDRAEFLLQAQLALAADIQRRLLPVLPTADSGYEWAAALRSAFRIGGDFYDVVEVAPKVWFILIADVSGKGVPAAMALGSLQSAFRALAHQRMEPAQILTQMSATFMEAWGGTPYVTCIVIALNVRACTLTYTNAGHPRGIVVGPQGTRYLDRGGPPAGLIPNAQFDQAVVRLDVGDTCLLVTDGVTEALEGAPPLEQDLTASATSATSAAELCERVMARALDGRGDFGDSDWDDDRTVVVFRMLEPVAASARDNPVLAHQRMLVAGSA
jgi:sigma-B regulation protein RsbU (phosphoserine phosphatase)